MAKDAPKHRKPRKGSPPPGMRVCSTCKGKGGWGNYHCGKCQDTGWVRK